MPKRAVVEVDPQPVKERCQRLIIDNFEAVVEAALKQALSGNVQMTKLIMEQIMPPTKNVNINEQKVSVEFKPEDIKAALEAAELHRVSVTKEEM